VARKTLAIVVLALALVFPASALAGSAGGTAASGYGGGANVQNEVASAAAAGGARGTLPFTGLDLTLIALAGVTLLGIGIAVRRRASQRAD
jgi:hypothetical protein